MSLCAPRNQAIPGQAAASIGAMASSFGLAAGQAPSIGDLETAEAYGRRIAEITVRWVKGKSS
jgi:NAD(P)H dehydrogenase (quinone)